MQAITRGHALNTVAHEGSRNFRRKNGRGLGRGHRGSNNTNSPTRYRNNNGGYTSTNSNGNLYDKSNVEQVVGAKETAATNLEEDERVGEMTKILATSVAGTARFHEARLARLLN